MRFFTDTERTRGVSDTAAKIRSIRVRRSTFDRFFEIEEVEFASVGSGEDFLPCIVCRTPKMRDEPCKVCAERPLTCMWCYAIREPPIKGACPSCGKYGVTKFLEREKSNIYVEEYDPKAK